MKFKVQRFAKDAAGVLGVRFSLESGAGEIAVLFATFDPSQGRLTLANDIQVEPHLEMLDITLERLGLKTADSAEEVAMALLTWLPGAVPPGWLAQQLRVSELTHLVTGVHQVPDVDDQPTVRLSKWRCITLPDGQSHLVGWNLDSREGRVSSFITEVDGSRGYVATSSGRIYELIGEACLDADAEHVLGVWLARNGFKCVDAKDSTAMLRGWLELRRPLSVETELGDSDSLAH